MCACDGCGCACGGIAGIAGAHPSKSVCVCVYACVYASEEGQLLLLLLLLPCKDVCDMCSRCGGAASGFAARGHMLN